jgi:hypothetical protein
LCCSSWAVSGLYLPKTALAALANPQSEVLALPKAFRPRGKLFRHRDLIGPPTLQRTLCHRIATGWPCRPWSEGCTFVVVKPCESIPRKRFLFKEHEQKKGYSGIYKKNWCSGIYKKPKANDAGAGRAATDMYHLERTSDDPAPAPPPAAAPPPPPAGIARALPGPRTRPRL